MLYNQNIVSRKQFTLFWLMLLAGTLMFVFTHSAWAGVAYDIGGGIVKHGSGWDSVTVATNGKTPAWSHDGSVLAYIATDQNAIQLTDPEKSYSVIASISVPVGDTAKKIVFSANDRFLFYSTSLGHVYITDLADESLQSVEVPGIYSAENATINDLGWDLRSGTLYYAKNGEGIQSISPNGTGKTQILNVSNVGLAGQNVLSFATDPDFHPEGSAIRFLTSQNPVYYSFYPNNWHGGADYGQETFFSASFYEYSALNTAMMHGSSGLVTATKYILPDYNYGYPSIEGSYGISFSFYPGPNPTITSVSYRSEDAMNMLYKPTMQNISTADNTISYDLKLSPNTLRLLNKSLSITTLLYDENMNPIAAPASPASATVDATYSDINLTTEFPLLSSGDYYIGCAVTTADEDPYMEQMCVPKKVSFTFVEPAAPKNEVYRFWSTRNQHHFFTANLDEAQYIVDNYPEEIWTYEGVAYYVPDNCTGKTSVYRFWSPRLSTHFFTMNATEKDYIISHYDTNTWTYEGVAYCADTSQSGTNTPLYRFWSPRLQGHFFTANATEKDYIISHYDTNTWTYEGVAYYVEP